MSITVKWDKFPEGQPFFTTGTHKRTSCTAPKATVRLSASPPIQEVP